MGNIKTNALTDACWYGEVEKVKQLLEDGMKVNAGQGAALYFTVSSPSKPAQMRQVLQLLLDHGVKVDTVYTWEHSGPAIAIALNTGHPQLAEMLLDAGADLKLKDRDGRTPLKLAKEQGYTKLVERMSGKKPTKGDPFIAATYKGYTTKKATPHTSGIPDWKKVFKGKHFPGCANPPVHLLTLDLAAVPEFPETVRKLGKLPIVGNACECDEPDDYGYTLGRDGRLSSNDDDEPQECDRSAYRPSKKATPVELLREGEKPKAPQKQCGIVVGGQPNWAQAPFWPPCTKCNSKKFFVATLWQSNRSNTLNIFVCPTCRTQSVVRQST